MCAWVWQVCARALLAGGSGRGMSTCAPDPCVTELGDAGVEAVSCGRHRDPGIWEPISAPGRLPVGNNMSLLSV